MSSQQSQLVSNEPESLRNRTGCDYSTLPRLAIPNDRSTLSIVSFVEWALVELTHEEISAEYRSSHLWGLSRTVYTAIDPEVFSKHHYDARVGWHTETLRRKELRAELVNRLSRSRPETSDPIGRCDEFVLCQPSHQKSTK